MVSFQERRCRFRNCSQGSCYCTGGSENHSRSSISSYTKLKLQNLYPTWLHGRPVLCCHLESYRVGWAEGWSGYGSTTTSFCQD
nr:hypothetical protein Iba_chr02dCG15800 [Ipomoea batatas]GMD94304.1 hypothetical protein Iba_scaffold415556CG0010 [Ipomoea batatas]